MNGPGNMGASGARGRWGGVKASLVLASALLLAASGATSSAAATPRSPSLDWAVSTGGSDVVSRDIAAIPAGGAVVTGSFQEQATFGTGDRQVTLSSNGVGDAFIARYRPDGSLDWAVSAGGSSTEVGRGVAVDASGNAVVTGQFYGEAVFGTGADQVTLVPARTGVSEPFVARYTADGKLDWVVSAPGYGIGLGVAVHPAGDVIVSGAFAGQMTFGEEDQATTLSSVNSFDAFVARYTSAGTLRWAVSAGGTGTQNGHAVAVTPGGDVVVGGYFEDHATFGTGDERVTLSAAGSFDVFVARYTADGRLGWAVSAGGSGRDLGRDVAVTRDGNVVITGHFDGQATFGSGDVQVNLSSAGLSDAFVARYTADGGLDWAAAAGGAGIDNAWGVAIGPTGDALITGDFKGQATFGTGGNQVTLSSAGSSDAFIARYAASAGTLSWAVSGGGPGTDGSLGVAVDPAGDAVVTGPFNTQATFGSGDEQVTLSSPGRGMFVARYGHTSAAAPRR